MSNHSHAVLYVDKAQADSWTLDDIISRWHALFSGIALSHRYLHGDALCAAELKTLEEAAEIWRERLLSVRWFMRCLNEHIARQANAEDGCTGRFWEGRFKSQALLDEAALAACLAYVDLNPIRAGIAETPESSEYTSVQRRIKDLKRSVESDTSTAGDVSPSPDAALLPFAGHPRQDMPKGLPFKLGDYLDLVEWSGRIIRDDKRGYISAKTPALLTRLQIDPEAWRQLSTGFEREFSQLIGREASVQHACDLLGRHWAKGAARCRALFAP
jgi:hypothetical protein